MNQTEAKPLDQNPPAIQARAATLCGMLVFLAATVTATLLLVTSSFGQNGPAVVDGRFHDDLLDHLVGKWVATGIVHGNAAKLFIEAEWVLEHQYLRIREKGSENVPGQPFPFEGVVFVGYNQAGKRYAAHEMTVWGGNDPAEGFLYAYRTGNEIKLVGKEGSEIVRVQRFMWDSASRSWRIESRLVNAGKEEEPFLDLKAVPAK